jgi:hypothetical protein
MKIERPQIHAELERRWSSSGAGWQGEEYRKQRM